MTLGNTRILIGILADILAHLILDRQLANGSQRVGHIDAQTVLMTIQCEYGHLRRVASGNDARHIAILLDGHL